MKRFFKFIVITALVLTLLFSLASPAFATELKTAIGTVHSAPNGLRLRAKPSTSAEVLTTAYEGDTVVVIRESGDWYLVNYNLYIGYVHKDYVTLEEEAVVPLGSGSVDPYMVNVRYAPSEEAEMTGQLYMEDKVIIIGFEDGWYRVKSEYGVGYIRSDLISLLDKPVNNKGTKAQPVVSPTPATRGSSSSGSSSTYVSGSSSATASSVGQQLVTYAKQFLGYPYVYGGASPSGFDCSGFMYYIYGQFGYKLYRGATSQLQNGRYVSFDELQPGDLVFFGYGSTATHVGMYMGNGKFIHAENSGTGVVISSLVEGYYVGRYLTARRIVN